MTNELWVGIFIGMTIMVIIYAIRIYMYTVLGE